MINRLNAYSSLFTNWLIHLTLLWSVFLFSGYVDSEYLTLPTSATTELVESKESTSSIFVFQKNNPRLAILALPLLFIDAAKGLYLAYNQLQQVKLLTLIQKGYNYTFSFISLPIKTIPTNSKEAPYLF